MTTTDTTRPLMACGHTAQGKRYRAGTWVPACVSCAGVRPGWDVPASEAPALGGRHASCTQCGRDAASSLSLPFFRHAPARAGDEWYCGCRGWD